MATSGSANFTINRDQIIDLAGSGAGIKGIGRVLSAEDTNKASRLLNLIVKQWMGKADFAPGLKVWTRKRAYLFPELGEHEYTLGTSGDHATASYSQTTTDAAEAIGQLTISVTSTTGMTAGDFIGIRCDDGSIHWSTISSFVVGDSVTIASALTVAAASGSTVYWYTTKITMPLSFISIRRKDTSSNETSLDPMTLIEYESIGNKSNDGDPSRYLYEKGITTGTLFLDLEISDTTEVYLLTYLRPIEDFDAATDTPDFPQEWERPLVGQLMVDWATFNGRPVTQEMISYRDEALAIAGNVDPDNEVVYFECEA
jgi:hypothetical protein